MNTSPNGVEVTQADREALIEHWRRKGFPTRETSEKLISAWSDDAPVLQMLAKHRITSSQPDGLNEHGWHLPSVNEGLRVARVCNGHMHPMDENGPFVLVPREPTEAMLQAGGDCYGDSMTADVWTAMLAATRSTPDEPSDSTDTGGGAAVRLKAKSVDPQTAIDQMAAILAQPADEPSIPSGMVPWHGAAPAPADWDGGPVLLRREVMAKPGFAVANWLHFGTSGDIIAYTPRATPSDTPITPLSGAGEIERLREAVTLLLSHVEGSRLIEEGRAMRGELDRMPIRQAVQKAHAALAAHPIPDTAKEDGL